MKNYKFKRAISYFVDFLIISLIITLLSNIKALNPKYNEYNKAYTKYVDLYNDVLNNESKLTDMDDEMKTVMFEVSYYGISYTIIEFSVILLYFTMFPFLFGGQTIGKKLLKLKISGTNEEDKVSFIRYFIRALIYPIFSSGLFYCAITLIGNLLGLVIFKDNHFITINKIFVVAGLVWGYIDTIYGLSRQDGKSIHDLVTKTQVVPVDTK